MEFLSLLIWLALLVACGMVGYYATRLILPKFFPKQQSVAVQGSDKISRAMQKTLDIMEDEKMNNEQVVSFSIYLAGQVIIAADQKSATIQDQKSGKKYTITVED